MKPWLRPAAKAAVLAAVAAGVASVGGRFAPNGGTATDAIPADADGVELSLDSAAEIVWERREGPAVTVRRGTDGSWRMVAPLDVPADDAGIGELLSRFAAVRTSPVPPAEDGTLLDPARVELVPPRLVVTARAADGTELRRLSFGGRNPYDGAFFVLEGSSDVVARVPAPALAALDRPVEDLRIRAAWPLAAADVERIELRLEGHVPFILERVARGWRFADGAAADPGLVEAWVMQIVSSNVRRYVDDPIPSSLPNTLVVHGSEGREASLRWRSATAAVRSALDEPPSWVELPGQLLPGLARRRLDLEDRRVLGDLERSAVRRIKLSLEGRFVVMGWTGGDWELRAPSTRPMAAGTADALLRGLRELRYLPEPEGTEPRKVDSGADHTGAPWLLELFDADGGRLVRLELVPRVDGRFDGKAGGRAGRVPEADVATLSLDALLTLGE